MVRLLTLLMLILALASVCATPAAAQSVCDPSQLLTPVSVALDGSIVSGSEPRISADGRYVAFISGSSNLVPNDTNSGADIFVYDRYTCQTTLASLKPDGSQFTNTYLDQPALSADGRSVAFRYQYFDTEYRWAIYVRDLTAGQTYLVSKSYDGSPANGSSHDPAISGDGRYIAFNSTASNLVPNDTNDNSDVFVYDRQSDTVTRVSVGPNGEQGEGDSGRTWLDLRWGTAISADGRYVAFITRAENFIAELVGNDEPLMLYDRQTGLMSVEHTVGTFPRFSQGGLSLTYTMMVVEAWNPSPRSSPFFGLPMLMGVHLHNLQTGVRASVAGATGPIPYRFSYSGGTSSDGRYTVYSSYGNNLVDGDTNEVMDVFMYELDTTTRRRVSINADGSQLPHASSAPDISGNGHYVVFQSGTNPVPPDGLPYGVYVVNLLHLLTPPTQLIANGDFSAGMDHWGTWDAITHQITGGVFEFYRNAFGSSAVVLQATGAALPANAPLSATFQLGNSSPNRKRITAIIHDSDWSDQLVCSFWIPPNTPPRTYTMLSATGEAWTQAVFSFYGSPAENVGWIQLDNVSLIHDPALTLDSTLCIDPSAP